MCNSTEIEKKLQIIEPLMISVVGELSVLGMEDQYGGDMAHLCYLLPTCVDVMEMASGCHKHST